MKAYKLLMENNESYYAIDWNGQIRYKEQEWVYGNPLFLFRTEKELKNCAMTIRWYKHSIWEVEYEPYTGDIPKFINEDEETILASAVKLLRRIE